ncbi:Down syndrome cell adhesion molecule-like protein 1 homolog [Pollicipes pollicipes]|uniref:Down syndrome cell adhesion molecule-like protein 1 homolog n=1 Tax=Pollicipes pollicipes TaxID=41117 RepID=UPI0018852CCD|nr:Down syndrome cell adhesion molecule-like protein 1 homolog [Pollicipes pollicipes]
MHYQEVIHFSGDGPVQIVSWVRQRDLKILTVGKFTYTSDHRFTAVHAPGSEEWVLKITSPRREDSGVYECQVSVEPTMSQPLQLDVVESRAVIDGPRELYLKRGSSINLTCTVMAAPEPPEHIFWHINNMVIKYTERGGIYVVTNRRARTSTLLVARATSRDSGNYSCRPSMAHMDTVLVHILDGEHPAAMQHGNSNIRCCVSLLHRTVFLLLLAVMR